MKATKKIIANGKVTIPVTIRAYYGLEDGDMVEIDITPVD